MVKQIASELWSIDQPLRRFGLELGARSILVRAAGELALLSPLPFAGTQAIDQLGKVAHVVAPSKFHYLSMPEARDRWPSARRWGAPGLAERHPELGLQAVLEAGAPLPDLDCHPVGGIPALNEAVFYHRPTRTLIVFDLLFNVRNTNVLTRAYLRITNAYGRLGSSLLLRYLVKDRAAVRASAQRIMEWDFDRLIPAHGDVIETGAKPEFAAAMNWV